MTPEAPARRAIDQFGAAKQSTPASSSEIAYFIDVEAVLPGGSPSFLAQLPFLGGVLHGAINQTLHESAASNTPAWRLIAPPCRTLFANGANGANHGAWLSASGALRFGVVVHGNERAHVLGLLSAVQRVQWLGSGDERLQVKDMQCRIRPVQAPLPTASAARDAPGVQLSLTWLTPLHMAGRAQVAAGHAQGLPPLLRIVRSLARRAMECQPDWAEALGIGTPAWTMAEEQLRSAQVQGADAVPVQWPYGSRTKPHPHMRSGLLGTQSFTSALSAGPRALLTWGPWLGVGEGTTFGCGGYEVDVADLDVIGRA
jgi:CRISPR-associated endoribonuclease Cas6